MTRRGIPFILILSGEAWECTDDPLSKAILGGKPVNDEDMGYGPALLLPAEEVHAIHNALKTVSDEWFRKRFSIDEMLANEIYPVIDEHDEEEFFEYVYTYFKKMVAFYEAADKENQAILFFLQ